MRNVKSSLSWRWESEKDVFRDVEKKGRKKERFNIISH